MWEWLIPTAVSAVTSAGAKSNWWDIFGKKKQPERTQAPDPLSDVKAQLMAMAQGIPEMMERRRKAIADIYSGYAEKGLSQIGENIHAGRGFGETSIEDTLATEFLADLASKQSLAESGADIEGLKLQSSILGGLARGEGDYVDIDTEDLMRMFTSQGIGGQADFSFGYPGGTPPITGEEEEPGTIYSSQGGGFDQQAMINQLIKMFASQMGA